MRRSRVKRSRDRARRGVASVLSMMFMILFGSLAAAMAIASQGNLRTAASHLHVVRSMGSAETGMELARHRLAQAASRFVVERGQVDDALGRGLWDGSYSSASGTVQVLPLDNGVVPASIADALVQMHMPDQNTVVVGGLSFPAIANAPAGLPAGVYRDNHWVMTPAIALHPQKLANATPADEAVGSAFQITYAPLANGRDIRIIVTGYDFDNRRQGRAMSRTVMQDFRLAKRIDHAIITPSKLLLGKNVLIEGDIGVTFEGVNFLHGAPMVSRSDFFGLDPALDEKLEMFYENLARYDVDGDNRIRVGHPLEGPGQFFDVTGNGQPDITFPDITGDGFLDEFDLFLAFYDNNTDGKVALSAALRQGTPHEPLSPEFVDGSGAPVDDDLALLIDTAHPDRNRNGVWGFEDLNNNGLWDPGEPFLDVDPNADPGKGENPYSDQVLGYRDGVLDYKDRYAKVNGRLMFRVSRQDWEANQGPLIQSLHGPFRPRDGRHPVLFEATDADIPDLDGDSFATAGQELKDAASGSPSFEAQVASNLGVSTGNLPTYAETKSDPEPQYYRLDPDTTGDGLPDNWDFVHPNGVSTHWEQMPFNTPGFSDYYYRPVYRNMVFRGVQIPMGTNALFVNCTFVGVTWVRSHENNTHPNWMLYGRMQMNPSTGRPTPFPARWAYSDTAGTANMPLPSTAKPPNQDLMLPVDPQGDGMDKADYLDPERPSNYDDMPDPLVINGRRVVNTKPFSNNIRFHDCTFIGSIVSDSPEHYTHTRNKLQFTGKTRFVMEHPDPAKAAQSQFQIDPQHLDAIRKSSMMLPQYSAQIGTFNSPPEQDVRLHGAVIAGILDLRGNTSVHGSLIMTFRPVHGQYPLVDHLGVPVGNPANFNISMGYLGADVGEMESYDPKTLPLIDIGGTLRRLVGWDINGDGLPDTTPFDPQPPGSTPVPFHGYGRIQIRTDPDMPLPDGLMLPVQIWRLPFAYREGRL